MTCIVVAADLSARSVIAIRRARMLAAEAGAELVVVHVVDDDLPAAIIERRRLEAAEILHAPSESDEAAELLGALETVAARPARLIAVHAHGAPAAGLMFHAGISRDAIAEHQRTDCARIRSRLAKAFGSVDCRIDIRVIDEVPLAAIRSVADAEGCDLIVVSSHARRAPLRGLLGSVSSALIREGFRDVMIVPRRD
jgi:nucleotide-binding universal stress UspA family protein